jgi:hypothetical protein
MQLSSFSHPTRSGALPSIHMSHNADMYHSDDETSPISIVTDPFLEFSSFDPWRRLPQLWNGFCLPTGKEEAADVPRCIRVADSVATSSGPTIERPPIRSGSGTDDEEEDEAWWVGALVPGTARWVRIVKGLETFVCSAFFFGMTLYLLQRFGPGEFWEWHYKTTLATGTRIHAPSVAWTFKS